MLVNFSMSPSYIPTNSSLDCFIFNSTSIIFSIYNITFIFLILPLCIFILHHGLQQWRQSHSTSSAAMSHFDIFTYHLVTMEIMSVFGCFLNVFAIYTDQFTVLKVGLFPVSVTYTGEMFFHLLTCLERYLAVVHPIIYLSLRKEKWIRIRNICIGCVWLLSLLGMLFLVDDGQSFTPKLNSFFSVLSLTIVSICSISVLFVLIRPGPGEQGGGRDRVDKSKKRAFYTILAILGMLVLRFVFDLIWAILRISGKKLDCVVFVWRFWVYLPSSLVLPLLFLLTKETFKMKCICCKFGRN